MRNGQKTKRNFEEPGQQDASIADGDEPLLLPGRPHLGEPIPFRELMARVRQGDQEAATELVTRYEPTIRRVVRIRLTNTSLHPLLDSMDICQSVMASFFVRAASGQYTLETPDHLIKLLSTIARSKLAFQMRKQQAQRRDHRRVTPLGSDAGQLAAPGTSPSKQVEARELLAEAHRRLTEEEHRIIALRKQGLKWEGVAEELGGSADEMRKKLTRALDRVVQELQLEEP